MTFARRRREMERARAALESAEERFLRDAGWEWTCDVASTWLWRRGSSPVVYLSKEMAIFVTLRDGER